jgi:hypothetical protein
MPARPITELYSELPGVYAAIADDRDFCAQSIHLLQIAEVDNSQSQSHRNCLELFAGPACHSAVIASTLGYRAYCIDSFPAMKRFACSTGKVRPSCYAVATLPCNVAQLFPETSFDLIFAPRYSLGYIRPTELMPLYAALVEVLSDRAVIVFEMHQPEAIAGRFEHLGIRERNVRGSGGVRYKCIWPDGSMRMRAPDGELTMSVRVSTEDPSGQHTEMLFESKEFLYDARCLEDVAAKLSLQTNSYRDERIFPGSLLVVHRRTLAA